jgi:S1-C subfamily serine protease
VRRLRLRYESGPRRGDELIFSGPRVRIGRSRTNSLVLTETDTPFSSGRHAEALNERGAWWIVDSGSTNGTFVNGAPVQRCRLRAGDVVAFGDERFVVSDGRRVWAATAAAAVLATIAAAGYVAYRRTPIPVEQIAAIAARSVYAVAIDDNSRRSIVGTAFAVDGDGLLATNAHIVDVLRQRGTLAKASAVRAIAIHGDTYEVRQIVAGTVDPSWQSGSLRADVGILQLERGAAIVPLPLADAAAFARVQRGMSLASFGFPGVSTDPQKPRGRLSVDVVGDVREDYVQTGLAIAPGTSGSPVFDNEGAVIAIVAGGDFVKGANGALVPSGSQANWAISVARIRGLLAGKR